MSLVTVVLAAAALTVPEQRLRDDLPRIFIHCAAQTRLMLADIKGARNPYPERIDKFGKRENVSIYGWTSGFFPGILWKLYEATRDESFKTAAIDYTDRLTPLRHYSDNHDIGFMLMCSMGNGKNLAPECRARYEEILKDGARQLAKRYNSALGLIRSWNHYDFPVIIDNMMNLEILEWGSKNPYPGETDEMKKERCRLDEIARSHADITDRNHFRPDSSAYHLVNYDPKNPGRVLNIHSKQGASVLTAWSRGQAWALYGFTMMYRETRERRYLERAIRCAEFTISHPNMPEDGIPYWDYGAPGEERDASAGAITASALLELSELLRGQAGVSVLPDAEKRSSVYRAFAVKELTTLSSPAYLAEVGTNETFLLMHSVGAKPVGLGVDVPFNFADYYYLEALLRFKKTTD